MAQNEQNALFDVWKSDTLYTDMVIYHGGK